MTECVVLFRNSLNGKVGFLSSGVDDDEDSIAVFSDYNDAKDATDRVPVCRVYPWQIVELDL